MPSLLELAEEAPANNAVSLIELAERAPANKEVTGLIGIAQSAPAKPKETFIQPAKKLSPLQKSIEMGRKLIQRISPEEASNIMGISEMTGLSPTQVQKDYNQLTKQLGLRNMPTTQELIQGIMTPAVAGGLLLSPIPTLAGLATFKALDTLIPTEKFIPSYASKDARATIELIDFIGKGAIAGGIYQKSPALIEKFTKNKITEFNLPKTIKLTSEQVRDIYQTGKLTTPEESSLYGSLGLTGQQLKSAIDKGVSINIPAEKIVTLADKPYWQKVKSIFGLEPSKQVTSTLVQKPAIAPSGLLPEKIDIKLPPPATPEVSGIIAKAEQAPTKITQMATSIVPISEPSITPATTQAIVKAEQAPIIDIAKLPDKPIPALTKEESLQQIKALQKQFNQALDKEDLSRASELRQQIKQMQETIKMEFPAKRQPKTLIGYVISQGGLDPQKLAKDYNVKLDFQETGLLSILRKGGRTLDDFYDELVGQNLIPPAPEDVNPMDWVKQQITESKGKYLEGTKAFEKQLEKEYNDFVENEKVEGVTDEDVRAEQKAIAQDIEKEITAKSDEAVIGEANWRLEFYDEFAKRIDTVTTPEELKDILTELTEEANPANKDAINELTDKADERYLEITKTPTEKIPGVGEQLLVKGTEQRVMPPTPLAPKKPQKETQLTELKYGLSQEKQGELFAGFPKSPSGNAMVGIWNNQIPVEAGQSVFNLKPVEFPELVSLVKELTGGPPTLKKFPKTAGMFYSTGGGKIKLSPELFKQGKEQSLAVTLAHEIGHLADYLPDYTLKRGNLLGRLLTLKGFLANTFGGISVTNKEVRQELWKVTQHLHPFDENAVPKGYLAYRKRARELYAEAISLLLNSPGTIEKLAPKFTKTFFDNLDKKPAVKEAYFGLQQLLSGKREDVLKKRQQDVRGMFVKGQALRDQLDKEKKLAQVNTWEKIRQLVDDVNRPLLKKIQDNEAKGKIGGEVEYLLQENSLVDNENYLLVADFDNLVNSPLQKAGLSIDDLGEYVFLKRVVGKPNPLQEIKTEDFEAYDEAEIEKIKQFAEQRMGGRTDIANPLGFAPKSAQEQLDFLKTQMGEEKFKLLEENAQKFHDLIFKSVEEAVRVGSYNQETFNTIIAPNKDIYATFGVLNYLQNYVPATVKMQKGTLQEIENPVLTTLLKTISLNRLNSRQRALNAWRDYWQQNFSDEIKPARVVRFGKGISRIIEPPKGSGRATVKMLEDGKLVGYDVDKYIAESFNTSKIGDLQLGIMLNRLLGNQIFKNLYITYNLGFAFAFNPIRDFKRAYVNLNALGHKITVGRLLVEYAKSLPAAVKRQQGIMEGIIREMMENKALDIPFIDFNYDIGNDSYQHILERLKLLEGKIPHWQRLAKPLLKPLAQILEAIRFGGAVIETLPKVVGYSLLKEKVKSDQVRAHLTRNYIGTPNFKVKGEVSSITNAVWMFSNIFKEGLKRDLGLAVNPKTRGGWWWANIKINLSYKFLMWLAATGALGIELKRFYDKATEYDKTNYIVIPLGEREDGKVPYLRIPHDETGRLMSALFWKTLNGLKEGDIKQIQQIFAFGAGQLPGPAPALTIAKNWTQYLTGKNPYDDFRGRYLIDETTWNAGGWPALKKMTKWTVNQTGLAQFATYDSRNNETFDTVLQLTPVVNRLLKVTDYGLQEKTQRIRQEFKEKQAQETLLKREVLDKYVQSYKLGADPKLLLEKAQRDIFGTQPISTQKRNALKEGFIKTILKDYNNPFINAFLSAASNNEKMVILKEMEETISREEYNKIITILKKFGY